MNIKHYFKKLFVLDFKFGASRQKGIALLLVIVVSSALLSIGAGIFNIALGQLKISGEIADSFIAFYAADQGIEQILFRDRNIGGLCTVAGEDCYEEDRSVASGGCYKVRVSKIEGDEDYTEVAAFGQYRCGSTPDRIVKRGFLVTYTTTYGYNQFGDGTDFFYFGAVTPGFNNLTTKSITTAGRTAGDMVNFSVENSLAPGDTNVEVVEPLIGLDPNDEVLIINLQRNELYPSEPLNRVGDWETQIVDSVNVATKTVNLRYGVTNRYDGKRYKIMLQRVPNYDKIILGPGEQLGVSAWNGTKGGVFFARMADILTLNGGEISMAGRGYRGGGQSLQGESRTGIGSSANTNNDGGGGGFDANLAGGAGGAGYAAGGGRGGSDPSIATGVGGIGTWGGDGGTTYGDSNLTQLFLGSGGGGGTGCAPSRGGNGGGIIYIGAKNISNIGAIRASASDALGGCPTGEMDGPWTGPGGGSGGSLVIQSKASPAGTIEVLGTNGLTGGVGQYCNGLNQFCYNNLNKGGNGSNGRTLILF